MMILQTADVQINLLAKRNSGRFNIFTDTNRAGAWQYKDVSSSLIFTM